MTHLRKVIHMSLLFFVIVAYQNCGSNESNQSSLNTSSQNKTTFTWINENIVKQKCVECHNNDIAFSGLNMTTYDGIMKAVVPGSPEESTMYTRSFSTTFFELDDQERDAIFDWIKIGALPN